MFSYSRTIMNNAATRSSCKSLHIRGHGFLLSTKMLYFHCRFRITQELSRHITGYVFWGFPNRVNWGREWVLPSHRLVAWTEWKEGKRKRWLCQMLTLPLSYFLCALMNGHALPAMMDWPLGSHELISLSPLSCLCQYSVAAIIKVADTGMNVGRVFGDVRAHIL